MKIVLGLILLLGLSSPMATAQVWNEDGDAGDLPGTAQTPMGEGALTQINGVLDSNDADMYCIRVQGDPPFVVATTCGGTEIDTQLWLFTADGLGLSCNDDDPGDCGLQSTITAQCIPAAGQYLIAVSHYDHDPVDAGDQLLFLNSPFSIEHCPPDGPGAANPIAGWSGTTGGGSYQIVLEGGFFCTASPVEPATWGQIKAIYH
jgi:hypothetical protein